jgi:tetratricopeptide (TPR) repeat protein
VFPDFGSSLGNIGGAGASGVNMSSVGPYLTAIYTAIEASIVVIPASGDTQGASQTSVMDYAATQAFLPYFDQYMPDKAASLRSQLSQISRNAPGDQVDAVDTFNKAGGVDDLLSKADKALDAQKDQYYVQAAMVSVQMGEMDRALSISRSIKDADTEAFIESGIRLRACALAVGKGDLEGAYKYAKDLANLQQRVMAFSDLSRAYMRNGDRQRSLEVLDDAEMALSKVENGPEKARAMYCLVPAVTGIDMLRGFEFMKAAINAINHSTLTLTAAGILTVGASETKMAQMNASMGLNTFNFNMGFPALARADLDGSLWLAQSLERKEASILAQLAICRSLMSSPRGDGNSQTDNPASKTKVEERQRQGDKETSREESKPKQPQVK